MLRERCRGVAIGKPSVKVLGVDRGVQGNPGGLVLQYTRVDKKKRYHIVFGYF